MLPLHHHPATLDVARDGVDPHFDYEYASPIHQPDHSLYNASPNSPAVNSEHYWVAGIHNNAYYQPNWNDQYNHSSHVESEEDGSGHRLMQQSIDASFAEYNAVTHPAPYAAMNQMPAEGYQNPHYDAPNSIEADDSERYSAPSDWSPSSSQPRIVDGEAEHAYNVPYSVDRSESIIQNHGYAEQLYAEYPTSNPSSSSHLQQQQNDWRHHHQYQQSATYQYSYDVHESTLAQQAQPHWAVAGQSELSEVERAALRHPEDHMVGASRPEPLASEAGRTVVPSHPSGDTYIMAQTHPAAKGYTANPVPNQASSLPTPTSPFVSSPSQPTPSHHQVVPQRSRIDSQASNFSSTSFQHHHQSLPTPATPSSSLAPPSLVRSYSHPGTISNSAATPVIVKPEPSSDSIALPQLESHPNGARLPSAVDGRIGTSYPSESDITPFHHPHHPNHPHHPSNLSLASRNMATPPRQGHISSSSSSSSLSKQPKPSTSAAVINHNHNPLVTNFNNTPHPLIINGSPITISPNKERKRSKTKEPHIACAFCRRRKIACVPGPSGTKEIGPCMPCAKRELDCVRPAVNRRGHKRKTNNTEGGGGDPSPSLTAVPRHLRTTMDGSQPRSASSQPSPVDHYQSDSPQSSGSVTSPASEQDDGARFPRREEENL